MAQVSTSMSQLHSATALHLRSSTRDAEPLLEEEREERAGRVTGADEREEEAEAEAECGVEDSAAPSTEDWSLSCRLGGGARGADMAAGWATWQ